MDNELREKIIDLDTDLDQEIVDLTEDDFGKTFEGDRITKDELLGKNFVIKDYEIRESTFADTNKYAIIQIELDGEPYVLMTGSNVLIGDLEKFKNRMPYRCSLEKRKSTKTKFTYYSLRSPIK